MSAPSPQCVQGHGHHLKDSRPHRSRNICTSRETSPIHSDTSDILEGWPAHGKRCVSLDQADPQTHFCHRKLINSCTIWIQPRLLRPSFIFVPCVDLLSRPTHLHHPRCE